MEDNQGRLNRSQMSESSLNKEHSIGNFKDDLDENSLSASQQNKILYSHLNVEGGPVPQDTSSQPSAEWDSDLNSSEQTILNVGTQEIK
jgi:hypothetical protein